MELGNLIHEYIGYISSESKPLDRRSIIRYQYILSVYADYLIHHIKINPETLIPYLDRTTPGQILSALDIYISKSSVSSEDTANVYISVVKEFFRFLKMKHNIGSDTLINSFGLNNDDPNSFFFQYESYLKNAFHEKKLHIHSTGLPYSDQEMREILKYCNNCLDTEDVLTHHDNTNLYNRFVKALATKLIIYTGFSVTPKLTGIRQRDLDNLGGTLKIGDYVIHVPFHLRIQFRDYFKIIKIKDPDVQLLTYFNGTPISQPAEIGNFYRHKLLSNFNDIPTAKPSSVICLAKYTILQMIDIGLDRDSIQSFTGYGDTVYKACLELSDMTRIDLKNNLIDTKLKAMPLYDVL